MIQHSVCYGKLTFGNYSLILLPSGTLPIDIRDDDTMHYDDSTSSEEHDDSGDSSDDHDTSTSEDSFSEGGEHYSDSVDSDDTQDEANSESEDVAERDNGPGDTKRFIVRWVLSVLLKIQHTFNLSNRALTAILTVFNILLKYFLPHPLNFKLPKSNMSALKFLNIDHAPERRIYVVCPNNKCYSLYKEGQVPVRCTRQVFSKACATQLMYERNLSRGRKKMTPFKRFQYIPLSTWLKLFLQRKEFECMVDSWKTSRGLNVLEDIYQGKIWKHFEAQGFFTEKYNMGLMLSVDWFNPIRDQSTRWLQSLFLS